MADANLLEALKRNKNRLDNIVVFGRVRCAIKDPNLLGKSVEVSEHDGFFAILDAYALKCLDIDYFGNMDVRDANKLYFTKGSMIIFIDDKKWIGQDVKVYKRGSSGVSIKRQWYSKTEYDGVTAFVFVRGQSSNFKIAPNKLVELGKNDSDVRGTTLQDFIVSVVVNKEGVIEYPITLDSISSYEGVINYEELKDEDIVASHEFVDSSDRVDVTKIDLNLTYHLDGAKRSQFSSLISQEVMEMSKARRKFAKDLLDKILKCYREEDSDDCDYGVLGHKGNSPIMTVSEVQRDIKKRFVANIASKDSEVIGNSKLRGNYYVGEFLKYAQEGPFSAPADATLSKDDKVKLRESIESLASMVQIDPTVLLGDYGDFNSIPLLRNPIHYAMVVMGILSGKDPEDLMISKEWMHKTYAIDDNLWFYILIRCPYLLGLMSPAFKLVDCDIMYLSFSRFYSKDCLSEDNMDLRANLIFLESIDDASDKDTLVYPSKVKGVTAKYPAVAKRYFSNFGFPARMEYVEALKTLLGSNISLSSKEVADWLNMPWYSEERLDLLSENGVIELIDDKMMLVGDMEKEFLIYNTLIEKGHEMTGVSLDLVQETIEDFEAEKGFKLEKLQKDGIQLTMYKAAVLSGCAGSGKTTTSDCMVEVFKRLDNFNERYELIFCAPTGKACRRLSEVIKSPVRTIHSQFGVFMGGSSFLAPVTVKRKNTTEAEKTKIYLLDEMAMCSMPLLYEICRGLGDDDFIYFLGDIKQLPPIGKGNPFALLMKLLPCIELGVSKRAAEGSEVNYNTTLINCMSDGMVKELSYNEKDFFCRECADASIPREVVKCWKEFMDGTMGGKPYEEDDIQVISGYQKEDVLFSAPQLNVVLQALLRSKDTLLFKHTNRSFYKNDRVIHLKVNDYNMTRYIEESENTFVEVPTFGMVNGEMGKLIGVARSDMVHFVSFNPDNCKANEGYYENVSEDRLKDLLERRAAREEDLRDDSKIKNNRMYFVKVKVYDVDLCKDVVVLYRASARILDGETILEGTDLSNLDLAYALTTHKMQGSQSPVVILPFGTTCSPMFINRNMLNTMVTRSQGVVCMVGSIKGADSPVNRGRQYVSPVNCSDLLTVLTNS